jgi:ABC-type transporter MlaC component
MVSLTSQEVLVLPPQSPSDFVVRTTVKRQNDVLPIDYKMMKNPAGKDATPQWQIYDVLRRQESVVLFYRRQFERMLKNRSPDDVIKELRNKKR